MQQLLNFYQMAEDIGTAGQPTRDQFAVIADAGYRAVINLARHDSEQVIPEEGHIVSALGMSYFHLPVPFESPNARHLRTFFGLMDALQGDKVLVHCAVNARVSAFVYQYLTQIRGVDSETATSPLLKRWLPTMDDNWRAIMQLQAADLAE